jgi:hypothetical protein
MKNKILIHICLLAMILVTSSCTPVVDTPTSAPIAVNTPTSTPIPSATPEFTPTLTSTPAMQCIPISYEKPVNDLFSGSLLLGSYKDIPYLLDLASWQLGSLINDQEDKRASSISVSSDHKWVAFKEFESDTIVIQSLLEHENIKIPIEGGRPLDWLDDQHLWIDLNNPETNTELLLNPFTGESKELQSSFPNQRTPGGVALDWFTAIYNSALTHLVYPTFLQEIILWDTQEAKIITTLHSHPILGTEAPVWSPDGDRGVIRVRSSDDYGPALLLVSKDGDVKVLLKSEDYSINEDSDSLLMTGFSWSPDQSKIAFWLTEPYKEVIDNTETKLAVINLDNQVVSIYCIFGEDPFISPAPLWSPDGKFLAVEVFYDFKENILFEIPKIIIFDFDNAYFLPIEDDFFLYGWLE